MFILTKQAQFIEQRNTLTRLEILESALTPFACHRLGTAVGSAHNLAALVLDYNKVNRHF